MKLGFIFAGAFLAGALALPSATYAATAGRIVLAQNDEHKEQRSGDEHGANRGGQMNQMGERPMMGGPNGMSGGNRGPGSQQMNGPMRGNMMMGQRPSRPTTIDRRAFQRNFRASRRFRAGLYVRPNGWYYRRWTFGQILPAVFWTQNYWLANYFAFGLPVPPPGYVWVRYGDDALLVNNFNGEILQVQYGVFY